MKTAIETAIEITHYFLHASNIPERVIDLTLPCSTQYLQWKPHVFDNTDLSLQRHIISGFLLLTTMQVLSLDTQGHTSSVLVFMHHMGYALIYFWSSDFPWAQQLHLLCAIQYKSNRVLGTVQLRDYSDYVILLFRKYS